MSNSHKCNPLCRIMFLFTFQECGVVRGVLIHWLVLFILTTSLSLPLSHFLHPLLLCLQSNPNPTPTLTPTPPMPLTDFLLSKEEELDYLTPPVWASHLPIFLPVDRQPAREVMEGEIRRSTFPGAASLLAHPSNMHGAALCRLRSECHSQLFFYCFLSSTGIRGTTREQLCSIQTCQPECQACYSLYHSTTAPLSSTLYPKNQSLSIKEPSWFFFIAVPLSLLSFSFPVYWALGT